MTGRSFAHPTLEASRERMLATQDTLWVAVAIQYQSGISTQPGRKSLKVIYISVSENSPNSLSSHVTSYGSSLILISTLCFNGSLKKLLLETSLPDGCNTPPPPENIALLH